MLTTKRAIATTELLLIFPAALFMTALIVRTLSLLPTEPARSAERIVMWYAGRQWTLWILLVALPLTVLVVGLATLLSRWSADATLPDNLRRSFAAVRSDPSTLLVALATVTAFGILVRVALHILAN